MVATDCITCGYPLKSRCMNIPVGKCRARRRAAFRTVAGQWMETATGPVRKPGRPPGLSPAPAAADVANENRPLPECLDLKRCMADGKLALQHRTQFDQLPRPGGEV